MMLLCTYGRASRLCAFPESVPRLVPRWWCRRDQRMCWTNHFSASCTHKYTRVPTHVPCCSAMPYLTYTPLTPPTPPRSPPGACAVAYAACAGKMQNQDFSFDPSHPSQLHPSLLRRRRAGRGSNLKCDVCQNYSPSDQALWQAVGGSVEGGGSACPDAILARGISAQHECAYVCARVECAELLLPPPLLSSSVRVGAVAGGTGGGGGASGGGASGCVASRRS